MGHIVNPNRAYRLLQRKLDRTVTGAPDSPILMQILSLLFSPEDADLARRIPGRLTTVFQPLTGIKKKRRAVLRGIVLGGCGEAPG